MISIGRFSTTWWANSEQKSRRNSPLVAKKKQMMFELHYMDHGSPIIANTGVDLSKVKLSKHKLLRRRVGWCPWRTMMVLDAILSLSIWDRLDSQVIGRTENLGGCTKVESIPYLFSLDLVSLILWFRAPNFAQELWKLENWWEEEVHLPERVMRALRGSQLVLFKTAHCASSDSPWAIFQSFLGRNRSGQTI